MIPNHAIDRTLVEQGSTESISFGLSVDDSAHIMHILRDSMYSDRILAVLREYSANAWDAHRSVGKASLPIKVTLPTYDNLTLRIRDFGPGLSREDVRSVFTRYGKSTKRNESQSVGMLGIGSKSAFAYSDTFTVTSFHGGMRTVYIAVLDESNVGAMKVMHESECGDETGVEIQVAVKNSDVDEFQNKGTKLFQHFMPQPEINIELPQVPERRVVLASGYVDYVEETSWGDSGGIWYAVMGCVPYRVRLDALDLCAEHRCLRRLSGVLPFNIGELQFNASREELKYTEMTKAALIAKFTSLVDEYVLHALTMLETNSASKFEQRLRLRTMADLGFELPSEWENYTKATVRVFDDVDKSMLYFVRDSAAGNTVTVTSNLVLLIDDIHRDLKGYDLSSHHYVVRLATKPGMPMPKRKHGEMLDEFSVAAMRKQLDDDLAACDLTGVPIRLLSQEAWSDTRKSRQSSGEREYNPKHRARMFRYVHGGGKRASDNWMVNVRVPTDDDVFVVIEKFVGYDGFTKAYNTDSELAAALGVEMPHVYGYKSTEKRPVHRSECTGTDYRVWREEFFKKLDTVETRARMERAQWVPVFGAECITAAQLIKLSARLGKNHSIVASLTNARDAAVEFSEEQREALAELGGRIGFDADNSEAKRTLAEIHEHYPLLSFEGIKSLWTANYYDKAQGARKRKAWAHYIKMIDVALLSAAAAVEDDEDDSQTAAS